jgi:hypothetical protein
MLIEFRIQMDDNGGVNIVPAQANANPNLQGQQQLGVAYVAPGPAAPNPAVKKGGDAPISDLGTGVPAGAPLSSGSGMVFVLGPIVICGSGPGHTGPGGDAPISDLGTGKPNGNDQAAAPNNKYAAANVTPKRRAKGK